MSKEEFAEYLRALQAHDYAAIKKCYTDDYRAHFDGATFDRDGVIEVEQMLAKIDGEYKWFTNAIYGRYLTPCRQCFAHNVSISYNDQEKTVTQVDGTASMPQGYTLTLAVIRSVLPEITPAP